MKFALLLLSTSLNLSIAADATRAVAARALETAEEKKAAADVVKALDLGDVVHSVTVKEQTYTATDDGACDAQLHTEMMAILLAKRELKELETAVEKKKAWISEVEAKMLERVE